MSASDGVKRAAMYGLAWAIGGPLGALVVAGADAAGVVYRNTAKDPAPANSDVTNKVVVLLAADTPPDRLLSQPLVSSSYVERAVVIPRIFEERLAPSKYMDEAKEYARQAEENERQFQQMVEEKKQIKLEKAKYEKLSVMAVNALIAVGSKINEMSEEIKDEYLSISTEELALQGKILSKVTTLKEVQAIVQRTEAIKSTILQQVDTLEKHIVEEGQLVNINRVNDSISLIRLVLNKFNAMTTVSNELKRSKQRLWKLFDKLGDGSDEVTYCELKQAATNVFTLMEDAERIITDAPQPPPPSWFQRSDNFFQRLYKKIHFLYTIIKSK